MVRLARHEAKVENEHRDLQDSVSKLGLVNPRASQVCSDIKAESAEVG
jgi:hypothetical protein